MIEEKKRFFLKFVRKEKKKPKPKNPVDLVVQYSVNCLFKEIENLEMAFKNK